MEPERGKGEVYFAIIVVGNRFRWMVVGRPHRGAGQLWFASALLQIPKGYLAGCAVQQRLMRDKDREFLGEEGWREQVFAFSRSGPVLSFV